MLYVSMFAYVRFIDDNIRQILPLDHIKDFCPQDVKDFEIKKKYHILWKKSPEDQGQYYKAQILKLAGRILKLYLLNISNVNHFILSTFLYKICCIARNVGIIVPATKYSDNNHQNLHWWLTKNYCSYFCVTFYCRFVVIYIFFLSFFY